MSNQTNLARALDALGDPMRRRILERLGDGPVAVGELADALPIGRPAVSRHLRVLAAAGLVEYTPRGTRNLYALAPDGQREVQQWLVTVWDGALASFAEFVESVESVESVDPVHSEKSPSNKPGLAQPQRQKTQKHPKPQEKPPKSQKKPPKPTLPTKKKPSMKRKHHPPH